MPEVTTVIPGAKTIDGLEQCIRGSDAAPFDQTAMDEVRAIQREW
jgi:aryl-alcohol dehydrogenase-like predicted oxidoreductase